jgi:glycosyltransferase involved in cell wall biosynthesis
MKTICLNMIVKDEQPVIQRCLASVKGIIDYWVIVDTGSSDGTQQSIRDFMRDIPGELYEKPWVNFEHNRNIALNYARNKADYILFIDADETLIFLDRFDKSKLDRDFYCAMKSELGVNARSVFLINQDPDWHWQDVLHEFITNTHPVVGEILKEIIIDCRTKDGHRSHNLKKSFQDIQVLEEAIQNDPANRRYVFYLAQSYGNAKNHSLALDHYKKRVSMGGDEEEIFWSLHCIGALQQMLQMDHRTIVDGYCQAFLFNPLRAEPLYHLACYFKTIGAPLLGYLAAQAAIGLKKPHGSMKLQEWIYDYGLNFKYSELSEMVHPEQNP